MIIKENGKNDLDKQVANNPDRIAITYESSIRYLIEQSNKRAWFITFLSLATTIIILLFHIFRPLTITEPYLVRVENTTGMVDILSVLDKNTFQTNEILDKYFATKYLKARESYFFDILEKDYKLVQMMSSPEIAKPYTMQFEGNKAKHLELKDNVEIDIEIISVTLENSAGSNLARIRFNANTKNKKNNVLINSKAMIATMAYEYQPGILRTEDERLKNPLGFRVTSYRIDDEIYKGR